MSLFGNIANKLLKEDFEADGSFYVYHGTRDSALDGISKKGFERFFSASNGGNLYGAGLYTTYKLSTQGQNAHGAYGQVMFKLRVKSLRNFIIYDADIAKRIYGKLDVDAQLRQILNNDQYQRIRNCGNLGGWRSYDYNKLINSRNEEKSSVCALDMCRYFDNNDKEAGYRINGYIFKGNHDGFVCFLRDFKNAYPVEVSNDCGRTWKTFEGDKTLKEFGIDDVDLRFQLGKHNYQLMQELDEIPYYFINGFAKVSKGGKYNYLYRKKPLAEGVISPVWFDYAPETFSNQGRANVVVNGETFIIKVGDNADFYVYYKDGKFLCSLDNFGRVYSMMRSNHISYEEDSEDDF
jgi:hypothetical protein